MRDKNPYTLPEGSQEISRCQNIGVESERECVVGVGLWHFILLQLCHQNFPSGDSLGPLAAVMLKRRAGGLILNQQF